MKEELKQEEYRKFQVKPKSVFYNRCYYKDLYDAYARPSLAKRKAWEECKALCYRMGGKGLCIVAKNTMQFTAAFEFENPANEKMLAVITRSNKYAYYNY